MTSTVSRSSTASSTQTLAPTVVKTSKPVTVASTNTSSAEDTIETGADGKPVDKKEGGALGFKDVSNFRIAVLAVHLVLIGAGMAIFA